MNPFLSTEAGFFIATGSGDSNPSLAQGIAAAVCNQVLQNKLKLLDPNAWQAIINQVPYQASANLSTNNQELNTAVTPANLVPFCLPSGSPLAAQFERALQNITGNLSLLNVFSVSEVSPTVLRLMFVSFAITPAFHDLPTVNITSSVTNIPLTDAGKVDQLNQVFGKFQPPVGMDYFISVNNHS